MKPPKPDYGNWVANKFIVIPAILGLIFLGLAFRVPFLAVFVGLFFLVMAYFVLARYCFSPAGADIQSKIIGLILDHLEWDGQGRAIDIGCGNAPLSVRLAKKYPAAQVTGIDTWGTNWGYAQQVCERNARLEGVEKRTGFQKASASALPFEAGSFDLAVSNLAFHEVNDTRDKRQVLREALRMVKPGGKFVFQDLFLWGAIYGTPEELIGLVKSWGIRKVELVKTRDAPFIPSFLKLPFMVGTLGILVGEK